MSEQLVAKNKKAYHDYEILDEYEAGMVLVGTEVKSLRDRRVTLKESYARVKNGEIWLENCHISPYRHGNISNHEPTRRRKLLLQRREINRIIGKVVQKGLTIVPLALYFKNGVAKLRIGVARGKKTHDKRETQRRKAVEREMQTELKRRLR